jgi:hypothetical protein
MIVTEENPVGPNAQYNIPLVWTILLERTEHRNKSANGAGDLHWTATAAKRVRSQGHADSYNLSKSHSAITGCNHVQVATEMPGT